MHRRPCAMMNDQPLQITSRIPLSPKYPAEAVPVHCRIAAVASVGKRQKFKTALANPNG